MPVMYCSGVEPLEHLGFAVEPAAVDSLVVLGLAGLDSPVD